MRVVERLGPEVVCPSLRGFLRFCREYGPKETLGIIGYLRSQHIERYRFVAEHLDRAPVLDVACGIGYGTEILQNSCGQPVAGLDIHGDSLLEGSRRHPGAFIRANAQNMPFGQNVFGTVVSLETLEHLPDPERFLLMVRSALSADGSFIVSSPNREVNNPINNPFHYREYSREEFEALLKTHF